MRAVAFACYLLLAVSPARAETLLREAVAVEETLPIAFGPPAIDKPTHEAGRELRRTPG